MTDDAVEGWVTEWGERVDAIRSLSDGDLVDVRTTSSTNPNRSLRVLPDSESPTPMGEAALAEDVKTQTRYIIEATYEYQGDTSPWLRTADGYDSAGEIGAIRVHNGGDDA